MPFSIAFLKTFSGKLFFMKISCFKKFFFANLMVIFAYLWFVLKIKYSFVDFPEKELVNWGEGDVLLLSSEELSSNFNLLLCFFMVCISYLLFLLEVFFRFLFNKTGLRSDKNFLDISFNPPLFIVRVYSILFYIGFLFSFLTVSVCIFLLFYSIF